MGKLISLDTADTGSLWMVTTEQTRDTENLLMPGVKAQSKKAQQGEKELEHGKQ